MQTKVYQKIRQSLTQEAINEINKSVTSFVLLNKFDKWVEEYNKAGGDRPEYIWKWLFKINEDWKHIKIQKKSEKSLALAKTLYNMFIVLLDDVAEQKGQEKFLDMLLKIPEDGGVISNKELSQTQKKYYLFTIKVWQKISSIINKYPFYKETKEMFEYDTKQFLNAVIYANMILHKPFLLNEKEYWMYIPHSMQILIDFDIDLMAGESFDPNEIGKARQIVLTLQEMGRVGNWISTWEREVRSNDYTSIVPAHAVSEGIVSFEELGQKNKDKVIKKIKDSNSVEYALKKWEKRYNELKRLSQFSKIISSKEIAAKGRFLLKMHISSTGKK